MTDHQHPQGLIDAALRAWVQEVDASPDDDDITPCIIAVLDVAVTPLGTDGFPIRPTNHTPAPPPLVVDEELIGRCRKLLVNSGYYNNGFVINTVLNEAAAYWNTTRVLAGDTLAAAIADAVSKEGDQ